MRAAIARALARSGSGGSQTRQPLRPDGAWRTTSRETRDCSALRAVASADASTKGPTVMQRAAATLPATADGSMAVTAVGMGVAETGAIRLADAVVARSLSSCRPGDAEGADVGAVNVDSGERIHQAATPTLRMTSRT